ncbi:hypothetical protein NUM3379_24180 [Kineococcus sp. NUM-3379]
MRRGHTTDDQRKSLQTALQHSGLTLEQLWLAYFTLGGVAGLVEVEAHLQGLVELPAGQGDMLAHALNEHLDEVLLDLRVPYSRVLRPPPPSSGPLAALAGLLDGMTQAPPERLVVEVTAAGAALGAGVTIHLVDYGQDVLIPLRFDPAHPESIHGGPAVPVGSSLAGQAFQRVRSIPSEADGQSRLWVPLLDGTERLGVLEFRFADPADLHDPQLRQECRWLGRLVGHLITATTGYGDAFDSLRRCQPRTSAAELIWNLLPPLTAATDRCVVAGQLEPSATVGGDAFDYALSESTAHLAIFDATGHTLASGTVVAAALAASRSVRRNGGRILEQARVIEELVSSQFADRGLFLTAVLAELDLTSGRLRYIVAGHPKPLILRQGRVVRTLTAGHRPLFGVNDTAVAVGEETLQPGDQIVLYTDGVTEARDENGDFFGFQRLTTFLQRAAAATYPPPETVRRLTRAVMEHQHDRLQDDATVLLACWQPHAPLTEPPAGDASSARDTAAVPSSQPSHRTPLRHEMAPGKTIAPRPVDRPVTASRAGPVLQQALLTALMGVVADFSRRARDTVDVDTILHDLVGAAAQLLAVTGAGVSIREGRDLRYVHASTRTVRAAEQDQSLLERTPAHDACTSAGRIIEEDLAARPERWPRFVTDALAQGLHSVASIPLQARQQVWGVLTLYRDAPGPLEPDDLTAAEILADLACGYVVMAHDRDVAASAQQEAAHAATHDPLTGLPNRALLYDRITHAVATTARRDSSLALLFLDLDDFKDVNDEYGHDIGDRLLVEIAARLSAVLRAGDTLARLGGDEFVIIYEGLHAGPAGSVAPDSLTAVVERIRHALQRPVVLDGHTITTTASIGVATLGENIDDAHALLRAADHAMYRTKRASKESIDGIPG